MTKRLLYKTSKSYLLIITILLVVSAPVFYFILQNLYLEDTDEALELHKDEFLKHFSNQLEETDIPIWNTYNRDIKIQDKQSIKSDIYFDTHYYDSLSKENEPYRELNAPIFIRRKALHFVGSCQPGRILRFS